MRFLLTLTLGFFLYTSFVFADNVLSPHARFLVNKFEALNLDVKPKTESEAISNFIQKYELREDRGRWLTGAVILVEPDFNKALLDEYEATVRSELGDIMTIWIPVQQINRIKEMEGLRYFQAGKGDAPFLDTAVPFSNTDKVHEGEELKMPYTGEGVIVGVTDNGFDLLHPVFRNRKDSSIRVMSMWNQREDRLTPPKDYDYGMELSTTEEFRQVRFDSSNNSHGTHVAGIAAGWDFNEVYTGVAYDADLIFVRHQRDVSARIDGFRYIRDRAREAGKPAVINTSWGNYHGPMDGSSLLSRSIDHLSGPGMIFVSSAGNNGNVSFHLDKTFNGESDTLRSIIGFLSPEFDSNYWGQSLTIWGSEGQDFEIQFKIVDSNGTVQHRLDTFRSAESPSYDEVWEHDTSSVHIRAEGHASSPLNGKPHMMVRLSRENLGNQQIALEVTATDGTVHLWNVRERTSGRSNTGVSFWSFDEDRYTWGNNRSGVSEPGSTQNLITVGSYQQTGIPGFNLRSAWLSNFSSRGPLPGGTIKPEITAKGSNVVSAINNYEDEEYNLADSLTMEGETFYYTDLSGTSMSAPVVSGIIALMLQVNPDLTHDEVYKILTSTAIEDQYTGEIPPDGDPDWGFGKVNAWDAMKVTELTTGIDDPLMTYEQGINVFPNPASESTYIYLHDLQHPSVSLHTLDGREIQINTRQDENVLKVEWNDQIAAGIYIITVSEGNQVYHSRLQIR